MARYYNNGTSGGGSNGSNASAARPVSGVYGTGQMRILGPGTHSFTVPSSNIRVRLWGAGGNGGRNVGGHGGGFAMKEITGLVIGSKVTATVAAAPSAQSSFGGYVSATGGASNPSGYTNMGTGVGGDINYSGGNAWSTANGSRGGGGGAANLMGNGGDNKSSGASGGGGVDSAGVGSLDLGQSIDFIGTGSGGVVRGDGVNGGGGGEDGPAVGSSGRGGNGGFPGGGGGAGQISGLGSLGLMIIEW